MRKQRAAYKKRIRCNKHYYLSALRGREGVVRYDMATEHEDFAFSVTLIGVTF
jgi:hypothetical protein